MKSFKCGKLFFYKCKSVAFYKIIKFAVEISFYQVWKSLWNYILVYVTCIKSFKDYQAVIKDAYGKVL